MERSRDWMDQAEGDLEHAQSDMEQGFYDWACFSSQQAAEKAVKAVFQKLGAEAWGHSVADLLNELSKRYQVPEELINRALELDKAYIPTRYPNAHPSGSPKTRYTRRKQGGLSSMQRRSSSSVRIFYPEFDREKVLQILSERLKALEAKLPLIRVVLFGSYAKENYAVGSDIDLLVVYRGEKRADAYAVTKRTLDIPRLEPHLYTEEEYKKMEGTISKMIEGGIVLQNSRQSES
jgi:HEPN domain-containing protein/predicted nucleotidyltransferase